MARLERQRLAVYGVAKANNQVLLCRASAQTEVEGWWWLPGGGVDFGESPSRALVREFMEETGLNVTVGPLLGILSDVRSRTRVEEDIHTVRVIYAISSFSGTVTAEIGGTTDHAEWHELSGLSALNVAPYVVEALRLDQ
jgi:ADP-ribose pyrophosphatase YjhB (NUDIX family)